MGLILPQTVKTKWNNMNREWFTSKGYTYTKYRDDVWVSAEDLQPNSSIRVDVVCDDCGSDNNIAYGDYISSTKHHNGKYYCQRCASSHFIKEKHPEKLMINTHPDIAALLHNQQDGYNYTATYTGKLKFDCPFCSEVHEKRPYDIINDLEALCPYTAKGVSFNNRLTYSILSETGLDFKREFRDPEWCKIEVDGTTRRVVYDFLILVNNRKILIELDGGFHYRDNPLSGQSQEESQEIDIKKEELAKEHGYEFYRIDCYNNVYSHVVHNRIINELSRILNGSFDVSTMDVNKCLLNARQSEYSQIWDAFNDGCTSITQLRKKFNRSKYYIQGALNVGKKLKKIKYITQYEKATEKKKVVIQMWENGVFDTNKISNETGVDYYCVIEYIQQKYKETQDPLYITSTEKWYYCIEDSVYYTKQYMSQMYNHTSIKKVYQSIHNSICRNGTYKGKHWRIMSRQEAYYDAIKNNKQIIA